MLTLKYPFLQRTLLLLAGGILVLLMACQRKYTPKAYVKNQPDQLFATICHHNKKTLSIPAEEWPKHKAHGDYRGPCRARGIAGPSTNVGTKNSSAAYKGRKEQLKASREAWERNQARLKVQQDSLISANKEDQ